MKNKPFLNERGLAVLTAVFTMIVFALLAAATVALISGSSQTSADEYLSQQAFHVADAGVEYTAKKLSSVADWSNQLDFTNNFGDGVFRITFVSKTSSTATIRSDGTVGGITRSILQELRQGSGLASAFQNALYTPQDISVEGSSSGDVNGPVSAGGSLTSTGGVDFTGTLRTNDPSVRIPQPDWAYWQSHASHYVDGSFTFSSGTYNGSYYVNGNVEFGRDVMLNGTITARGSVRLTGNSNIHINAVQPNPAIIAEEGVTFTGTSDVWVNGFIFTLAAILMTGNSGIDVNGGMIAGDDVTFTGNTNASVDYVPVDGIVPGFIGGEGTEPVVFVKWQEVF